MNQPDGARTALVFAEYHLFQIKDPEGALSDDVHRTDNGLVSALGGNIEVLTGIHTGNVEVTVELHTQRPDPVGDWEEIAEISCHSPSGEMLVTPLMDDPADLPSLAFQGPGSYRLRVHATGRGLAIDGSSVRGVVEAYLIQSWPAAHQDALLLKATDAYGRHVRARPAKPTIMIDYEDDQTRQERDILRRSYRNDYS
ncbi:hypothetical protein [Streptomyces sp. enrichment culture]|uniref:hypothetical protein n=1 Tax=Streptomyces sp. enrichment culture TaxID=1795815 RepID=UPI003F54C4CF